MEKERQGKKKARTEGIFGCTPSQGGYKLLKETKASQHKNTEKRCVCEKCKKFNSVTRFFFYNFIYHTKSIYIIFIKIICHISYKILRNA